jgi:argonaute-like protein implicated in RNA metabolism and viral defense
MIDLEGNRIEEEPDLLFDEADTSAINKVPYWGLRNFGPYNKETNLLRLGIISPANKMQDVENLVRELNEGTSIFPGGMPQFFRCRIDIEKRLTTTTDDDVKEYEEVARTFIKGTDYRKIDAVLVYTHKTSRYLANTPYYRLKALFTSNGYPTQIITQSTFDNIRYSYVNLGSALFAKAGYIPWVLQSEMKNVDIIIGISVSNVISSKNRAGTSLRFVGYANVFDTYGKWMFFEGTGKTYSKEEKLVQLRNLLEESIMKFKATNKVVPRNIAIHHWKRFSDEEITTTEETLGEVVGDHNTAFITIDDSHPFRMYDTTCEDGSFPRGHYAFLGDKGILLSTTGATEISGRRMGTPKLLHISSVQKPNDFLEPDDIALQIFSLTKLNWASATPLIREPVSLLFSRKIAHQTATMSDPIWNDIVNSNISATLNNRTWFI